MGKVFVVGITGRQGAGKSALCRELLSLWNGPKCRVAIGDALKAELADTGIDTSLKTPEVRQAMQAHGKKRRAQGPDCFIDATEQAILEFVERELEPGKDILVVVDDVRMVREAEWLRQFCASRQIECRLVRIVVSRDTRAGRLAEKGLALAGEEDATETEQDRIAVDWTVTNNDSVIKLIESACLIICDLLGVRL